LTQREWLPHKRNITVVTSLRCNWLVSGPTVEFRPGR
jgi:hypothetical protein